MTGNRQEQSFAELAKYRSAADGPKSEQGEQTVVVFDFQLAVVGAHLFLRSRRKGQSR